MDTTPTGWRTQLASGAILLTLGVGAGGLDALNNWTYGIKTSPMIGGVYVAAAIGVMVLHGRSWLSRGVLAVALVMTLLAGVMAYRTDLGSQIGTAGAQNARYEIALAEAKKARETRDAIHETGSVEGLEELKRNADAKKKTDCRRPKSDECKDASGELTKLIGRVEDAKARDKAQAALDKADAEANAIGGPVQVSAIGSSTEDANTLAWITTMLALALTQGLAMHTGQAWGKLTDGWQARKAHLAAKPEAGATTLARKVAPKKQRKDDVYALLCEEIRRKGGKLEIASGNVLADELKVSRSTMANWLKEWTAPACGKIVITGAGRKKIVRIGSGRAQAARAA